jgi:heptosyltransferase III
MMNSLHIQKVLIRRLGSLGDTLVALPAFRLVRDAFPEARITVLTNHAHSDHAKSVGMQAILAGAGLVDDYLYYPLGLRDPGELFRLRNRIARERFDIIVYVSSPDSTALKVIRDALFFLGCGIRRQYGVPYTRRGRSNARVAGTDLYQSESDRLVSNLQGLGKVDLSDDRWWNLGLSADEQKQAHGYLSGTIDDSPFFALSVGTKAQTSDWTQPNWLALVRALNDRYSDRGLVMVGSPDEYDRSESLLNNWSGRRLNLCGKPSPRVSAAILGKADLYLGHDSGPMHLAANVGTPCVAVFSARMHPGVWYPRGNGHQLIYHKTECANCKLFVCVTNNKKCILSISKDEVLEAVEKALAVNRGRQRSVSLSSI